MTDHLPRMSTWFIWMLILSTLTDAAATQECKVCMEGTTAKMTFFIRESINFARDKFYATVRGRSDQRWDIIVCDGTSPPKPFKCQVNDPRYNTDGIQHHRLTLQIPNATLSFEDRYIFQAHVNGSSEPPSFCALELPEKKPEMTVLKTESSTVTGIIAVVFGLLLLILIILIILLLIRKRKNNTDDPSRHPLIVWWKRKEDLQSHLGKRWFFGEVTDGEEKKLLGFQKNKVGSFLIKAKSDNTGQYILAVRVNGTINELTLIPEEKHFVCPSTGGRFDSLRHAVKYYKEHDIVVSGSAWGKLSKPFERPPEEDWFWGHLAEEHEAKVFQANREIQGCFVIVICDRDPEAYCLRVNDGGTFLHLGIVPEESGYRMLETGQTFLTLAELVDHYKNNAIRADKDCKQQADRHFRQQNDEECRLETDRDCELQSNKDCRLTTPCPKEPYEGWYAEAITSEDEEMFSNSKRTQKGSFLITKSSNNQNAHELAVFLDGGIRHFAVRKERNGFVFVKTDMFFYSWFELVDYYRKHAFQVSDTTELKLTKPLRKEPTETWYVGHMTGAEAARLLLSGGNGPGSFLVRDCDSDPQDYILAANCKGNIMQFTIHPHVSGFKFSDTGEVFPTLSALVEHYKENELPLGDTLQHPVERNPRES